MELFIGLIIDTLIGIFLSYPLMMKEGKRAVVESYYLGYKDGSKGKVNRLRK